MKTLVVSLKSSAKRREHMRGILQKFPSLDVEFIDAVDGREMTPEELNRVYDVKKGNFRCMGKLYPGEIGCTLSHQMCYHKIAEEQIPYALILEDDLVDDADLAGLVELVRPVVESPEPRAVLLSGKFWWLKSRPLDATYRIASIFDGYMAHAYVINLAGARQVCEKRPGYLIDNWRYLVRKGLHMYGLIPHPVDQARAVFGSDVNVVRREPLDSLWERIWSRIWREPFKYDRKRLLQKIGHFEPREKAQKDSK